MLKFNLLKFRDGNIPLYIMKIKKKKTSLIWYDNPEPKHYFNILLCPWIIHDICKFTALTCYFFFHTISNVAIYSQYCFWLLIICLMDFLCWLFPARRLSCQTSQTPFSCSAGEFQIKFVLGMVMKFILLYFLTYPLSAIFGLRHMHP